MTLRPMLQSPWLHGAALYLLCLGPLLLLIENYRSGLFWELMRRNEYIIDGLRQAGFSGGWLDEA